LHLRLVTIFVLLFVILETIGFYVTKDFRNKEITQILDNSFQINKVLYKSILNSFEDKADLIFDNIMENQKEIESIIYKADLGDSETDSLRQNLLKMLEKKYLKFKDKYKVRQVHFHLSDGVSFLRLHKPNKFGDSLWDIRASLRKVHNLQKVVRGFEEGRIFNGFRNVYPIFKENRYIGSVEISFSFNSIRNKAIELLPYHYEFMIHEKTISSVWKDYKTINYIISDLSTQFYYDSETGFDCAHTNKDLNFDEIIPSINSKISQKIFKRLDNFQEFSVFTENRQHFFTVSFIPIKSISGENSAYFIVYDKNNISIQSEFHILHQRMFLLTLVLSILLAISYLLILKESRIYKLNSSLKNSVKEEIDKNKEKDKVISQQSKFSAMAEMMSSIAHQWRQPLNRISLEMINIEEDFLYDELTEENLLRYSEGINSDIQYLSKIIDDFREFYKPISQQEKIAIVDLISSVMYVIKEDDKKNAKVNLEFQNNLTENIIVQFGKELKQVLINLINNAIDSVDENDGKVILKLNSDSKHLEIHIEDNGSGIDSELAEKIFQPYFSTKFSNQGTGMGLYVSKLMIETNMNGKLSFQKNKDRGTTFTIKLPKR